MIGSSSLISMKDSDVPIFMSRKNFRQNSEKTLKLKISPAQITNFKSLNKLKIKQRNKENQGSSLNKRRVINLQAKLGNNGFLEKIQNMSSQKKIALNMKIKEKMSNPCINPDFSNTKSSFHFKNNSDIHKAENSQFMKVYTTNNKLKVINSKECKYALPHAFIIKERGRKNLSKESLQNPISEKNTLDLDFWSVDSGKRSSSLNSLQNSNQWK